MATELLVLLSRTKVSFTTEWVCRISQTSIILAVAYEGRCLLSNTTILNAVALSYATVINSFVSLKILTLTFSFSTR